MPKWWQPLSTKISDLVSIEPFPKPFLRYKIPFFACAKGGPKMPPVRTVDARWAYHAVKRLGSKNVPTDPILKEAGLRPSQIGDPDSKIPFHKHAALLTLAAEATGDDFFGLHLGSSLRLRQAGVLGFLMLNSETLGDALASKICLRLA